jgi:hypothetical protein
VSLGRVPPLPQPVAERMAVVRAMASQMVGRRFEKLERRKKRMTAGKRQRSVVRDRRFAAVVTSVTVLMVAAAFCGEPLRVMLEGSREQVAYCPGLMGVQLRTTVPVKLSCGVRVRL